MNTNAAQKMTREDANEIMARYAQYVEDGGKWENLEAGVRETISQAEEIAHI